MQRLIIDRFEGKYAVCEKEDRSIMNIIVSSLPQGAVEGSCLILNEDGSILLDNEEFRKRKYNINKLMEDLFE